MIWKSAARAQVGRFEALAQIVGVGIGERHERVLVGAFVIATHRSKSIDLPVVRFERPDLGVAFVLRDNFYNWKLSVLTERPIVDDGFQYLFNTTPPPEPDYTGDPLRDCYFEGFPSRLVFGYYGDGHNTRWSAEIHGDDAVWTTLFLCMKHVGGLARHAFHTRATHRAKLDAERKGVRP